MSLQYVAYIVYLQLIFHLSDFIKFKGIIIIILHQKARYIQVFYTQNYLFF